MLFVVFGASISSYAVKCGAVGGNTDGGEGGHHRLSIGSGVKIEHAEQPGKVAAISVFFMVWVVESFWVGSVAAGRMKVGSAVNSFGKRRKSWSWNSRSESVLFVCLSQSL